jgi:hypothetical protein
LGKKIMAIAIDLEREGCPGLQANMDEAELWFKEVGSCLPSTEFASPEFFSQIPAFLSLASKNPSFESFSHA